MRAAPLVLVLALAACAGPIQEARRTPAPLGDSTAVRVYKQGAAARRFAEEVAARCLMDGVVGGAAMLVDRASGRVVIVGDRDELVAIDLIPLGRGETRLRLSGPAIADRQMRERILYHIDRAARTGDTACPMLTA